MSPINQSLSYHWALHTWAGPQKVSTVLSDSKAKPSLMPFTLSEVVTNQMCVFHLQNNNGAIYPQEDCFDEPWILGYIPLFLL